MPWHIARNHSKCPSSKPYAVVKDSDGSVAGCHATRDDAQAQMAALYANEPAAEESQVSINADEITKLVFQDDEGDCPPGHMMMPDGSCEPEEEALGGKPSKGTKRDQRLRENDGKPQVRKAESEVEDFQAEIVEAEDDEDDEDQSGDGFVWQGVMVVEDERTGDGRMFAGGSLTWPDPSEVNIPLQWQKETSHGGINDVTVNVGRVTEIWRDGNKIYGRGPIDTDNPDGAEVARRLSLNEKLGVSIVADDPENEIVELQYAEGCEDGGIPLDLDDLLEADPKCFFPETTIFHSGRIRALTVVDVPAFVDAMIALSASTETVVAGAVGSHSTATSDASWDASANEKRLPMPVPMAKARAAYAWIDTSAAEDGAIPKSAGKFIHHEIGADGSVGAANLTACSAGIGILHGGRGGTTIPSGDRRGVYNHLAKHLRDGGQEPPPFSTADEIGELVAAAHLIAIPDVPPAEWFVEPTDMPAIGALTVTDEGRVYGYLAPRGVAHRSFPDRRLEVPMHNVDYSTWMNRPTIIAGGERIATGPITMDCGHAAPVSWIDGRAAREHYDNTCSVVATVRIGENSHGVWIAGALLHDVTPDMVARMLACQLSGDWRPHPERPGMREFAGALLVPQPGFPMATARFSFKLDHGELVASTVPVHWSNNLYREVELPSWEEVQVRLDHQKSLASDEDRERVANLTRELGLDMLAIQEEP